MARPKVGEDRRAQILAAFEACVVRKGLAQTTLVEVAEEAGQPRSLVRYFIGNRADMVSALIDRLLERGEAQFRQVPKGATADQLLDTIFADETTNIIVMELWHVALRDAALRARLAAVYERVILEVAALSEADSSRNRAFAAVSVAFGAAFFRHLGLAPTNAESIRSASQQMLILGQPIPAGA
jgi:AcrR family transcriptional regulator